jgi:ABC-type nitrate/sulfonate/bicarbonate transport system ATPase subunit
MSDAYKLAVEGAECLFGPDTGMGEVDLNVKEGEFVAIVGPSGCGKSTLMNIIAGITKPTRGRVVVDGEEVTDKTGHVGYMFQKDLLVPWRTVTGNIVLGAALTGRVTRKHRQEAQAMARKYGLGEFVDHYPHALSGGMRQRVALMRTLAFHRDILLLDEPFGALDSQTRLEMQQWLLRIWQETGRTILFITHDVDEAIFLADRVVVMSPRPGRINRIFDVPLDRPRTVDSLTSEKFTGLKRDILDLLYRRPDSAAAGSDAVA